MAKITRALAHLFPARHSVSPLGLFATREAALSYARRQLGQLGHRFTIVDHSGGVAVYRVGGR
ncbi:hypothetical protein LHK_01276 [Laribacter hongkongensis HLHK9]|uniref:Uncharacterized protein n=1 Tax=Laribacter hongkongensis (strain HLHK9) TaxID=557598 RepID=C1D726_LARHH|nr:hypothetical protein [Laribacter hongkongensis]ACO74266.1 hypothetical protein LHK_01276 [Laribacter hongkongensis HLHK9]